MIRIVLLVVVVIVVFLLITKPDSSGENIGEILKFLGEFLKVVLTALLELVRDVSGALR